MRKEHLSDAEIAHLDRLKQAKKLIEEVIDSIEAPKPKAATVEAEVLPKEVVPPRESTVEVASDASENRADWRQGERFRRVRRLLPACARQSRSCAQSAHSAATLHVWRRHSLLVPRAFMSRMVIRTGSRCGTTGS